MQLDAQIPEAPIEEMWETHREHLRLVGARNRSLYRIIVVGTGLAGASAAASLAAMGYRVECFCFQDSPRRAHSVAAQGGINAAKDYRNDGDSVYRLFYDTQKGGDFRSREGTSLSGRKQKLELSAHWLWITGKLLTSRRHSLLPLSGQPAMRVARILGILTHIVLHHVYDGRGILRPARMGHFQHPV